MNGSERSERSLARILLERHPDDAARLLESADDAESARLLDAAPAEVAARVLACLTPDRGARVLAELDAENLRRIASLLSPSRAAAMLARLDAEQRERVLAAIPATLGDEFRAMMQYPDDSAGALMDPRVTSFRPDTPVRDVVRRMRRFRSRRVQDLFLVDPEGRLSGSATLQEVVLAQPDTPLEQLSPGAPPRVAAVASREEICEVFEREKVANLPVVDFDGHLLGVLHQQELVAATQEQATAASVTMFGAGEDERALSPPLFAVRKRLPWLEVNLLTAFLAAAVVGLFEETIAAATALAVLLPVVAGQSGNTGAQALAVTMRGLALREIRIRHALRVITKEGIAGATNGVAVALTTAGAVYLWSRSPGLALVIGSSMILSMTMAGLAGAAIPLMLTALRQDPAQSSSIILTTVTDVAGFFSFLGIATLLASFL